MPIFFHDIVLPNDPPGFSIWLQEHYLEHAQFVRLLQSLTPPIFIPDYNFALFGVDPTTTSGWLEAHQTAHLALRNQTGVGGVNLADVNFSKEEEWQIWMDTHADEHSQIRAALGIT
jgi:hypothetical protein